MKRILLCGSAVMLSMLPAVAAPDMQSYVARVPAWPANPPAAGAAFGGKGIDAPVTPNAITALENDLTRLNTQAARASAPSAAQMAAGQATSQDIAAKMQTMTMDQRIAYAMQLQRQMAPAGPAPMALDDHGAQMARSAGTIMQQTGRDQQRLGALQGQVANFSNTWKIQDQQIAGKDFLQRLCTPGDRAANSAMLAPHLALASRSLAQGAGLEHEIRAIAMASAQRNVQAEAILASGPQGSTASAAASGSRTLTQSAILALLQLYDSTALAARYQHMSDFNAHAPVTGPCHDYGGG